MKGTPDVIAAFNEEFRRLGVSTDDVGAAGLIPMVNGIGDLYVESVELDAVVYPDEYSLDDLRKLRRGVGVEEVLDVLAGR